MLTKVSKNDVPSYRAGEKSEVRRFALETAKEFLECSEVGDIAEVTGAPIEMDASGVQKLANAFRDELFYMDKLKDMRKHVKVITRGGKRLFLERVEPFELRKVRYGID